MNKDLMLKWADVLESGKYNQYQGGWGGSSFSGYCCLNVALTEFGGEEYDEVDDPESLLDRMFTWNGIPANEFFTPSEYNAILAGDQEISCVQNHFVTCNDTLKMSFPEIAAKIRNLVDAHCG